MVGNNNENYSNAKANESGLADHPISQKHLHSLIVSHNMAMKNASKLPTVKVSDLRTDGLDPISKWRFPKMGVPLVLIHF